MSLLSADTFVLMKEKEEMSFSTHSSGKREQDLKWLQQESI